MFILLPLSVKLERPNSSMLLAQEEYTEISDRFVKKDEESAQMSGAEGGSAGKCLDNWKPTKRNILLNERAKMKCCSCPCLLVHVWQSRAFLLMLLCNGWSNFL